MYRAADPGRGAADPHIAETYTAPGFRASTLRGPHTASEPGPAGAMIPSSSALDSRRHARHLPLSLSLPGPAP